MAATQYVTATFTSPGVDQQAVTWSDLGGTQYILHGVATTDGSTVGADLVNVTRTGATVAAFASFNGTVTIEIVSQ